MKNEKDMVAEATIAPNPKTRPEPGAESQLHNYNVMLSRLGDLFDEDGEARPATPIARGAPPTDPK